MTVGSELDTCHGGRDELWFVVVAFTDCLPPHTDGACTPPPPLDGMVTGSIFLNNRSGLPLVVSASDQPEVSVGFTAVGGVVGPPVDLVLRVSCYRVAGRQLMATRYITRCFVVSDVLRKRRCRRTWVPWRRSLSISSPSVTTIQGWGSPTFVGRRPW